MLGLPEALPPSVLSADAGDRKGDGGDAATKADVGGDMVTAFRGRIKQCSKLPSSLSPSDDLMIKLRILMTPDGRLAAEPMVKEGTASMKAVDLRNSAVAALSGLPALHHAAGGKVPGMEGHRPDLHAARLQLLI